MRTLKQSTRFSPPRARVDKGMLYAQAQPESNQ